MTERGFVIGNGRSREGIDLNLLRPYGKIYGCNALYREFKPDVLVAVDRGMIEEITQSGYDGVTAFRSKMNKGTHLKFQVGKARVVDFGWAAGPSATRIMCKLERPKIVYLLGHDVNIKTDKINNMYAGTKNYPPVDAKPVVSSNFTYALAKCFQEFPKTVFIHVSDNELPISWSKITNIQTMSMSDFKSAFIEV